MNDNQIKDIAISLSRIADALEDILNFLNSITGKNDASRMYIRTLDTGRG